MFVKKKKAEELSRESLREIILTPEDEKDFEEGIRLFNEQKFWHAHESWEKIWQRHSEDERIFFQGIIQLAAAYHHLVAKKSFRGMVNNFEKAKTKLELFPKTYLRIDVAFLLKCIEEEKTEMEKCGENKWKEYDVSFIPKIILQ
ncbi:MAG: DUF309 domain-containing protein [Ignavibacteriales bacterium]|nr:DUF309 domain-containing protein [Ignavibacteriales bacterium]